MVRGRTYWSRQGVEERKRKICVKSLRGGGFCMWEEEKKGKKRKWDDGGAKKISHTQMKKKQKEAKLKTVLGLGFAVSLDHHLIIYPTTGLLIYLVIHRNCWNLPRKGKDKKWGKFQSLSLSPSPGADSVTTDSRIIHSSGTQSDYGTRDELVADRRQVQSCGKKG